MYTDKERGPESVRFIQIVRNRHDVSQERGGEEAGQGKKTKEDCR